MATTSRHSSKPDTEQAHRQAAALSRATSAVYMHAHTMLRCRVCSIYTYVAASLGDQALALPARNAGLPAGHLWLAHRPQPHPHPPLHGLSEAFCPAEVLETEAAALSCGFHETQYRW